MKSITTALLVLALGTGSVQAENQVIKRLKNCGSQATNSFGSHKEFPAVDEGNGFVSFQTEDQDAKGTSERYSLVNCATRTLVRIEATYLLANSAQGVPNGDLFSFTDGLRKNNKLANEPLLARLAKARDYKVTQGKLPAAYSDTARRSDCGCATFYPELMP